MICESCKYYEHREWEDEMISIGYVTIHVDYCHFPLHNMAMRRPKDLRRCNDYEKKVE